MTEVLASLEASEEIAPADRIYDWLIGVWDVRVRDYTAPGEYIESRGEWHFGWVLEGRAIQDVWICPVRSERYPGMPKLANRYGTSLRFYHPQEKRWHVVWINPVSGVVTRLVAERKGADIVQTGTGEGGNSFRWVFSEITRDSARWYAESSSEGEPGWVLEAEFFLKRAV